MWYCIDSIMMYIMGNRKFIYKIYADMLLIYRYDIEDWKCSKEISTL